MLNYLFNCFGIRKQPVESFVKEMKNSHMKIRSDIEEMKATLNGEDDWFLKRERTEQ